MGRPTRPSPLRARRLLRGERLRDTARAVGVHETYLSLVERGERPLRGWMLAALGAHYATAPEQLCAEMTRWLAREAESGCHGVKP